jgi:hypothetical protein
MAAPNVKDAEGPIAVFPRTKAPVAVVLEPPLAVGTDLAVGEQAAEEPGLPGRRGRRHLRREEGAAAELVPGPGHRHGRGDLAPSLPVQRLVGRATIGTPRQALALGLAALVRCVFHGAVRAREAGSATMMQLVELADELGDGGALLATPT